MAILELTPASNLFRMANQTNRGQNFQPRLINRQKVSDKVERLYFEPDVIVEAVSEPDGVTVFYRDNDGYAVTEYGERLTNIPKVDNLMLMDAKEPTTPKQYYAIAKSQLDENGEIVKVDAPIMLTSIVKDLLPENIPGILRLLTFSDNTRLSVFHTVENDDPTLHFLDSSGKETTLNKGQSSHPDEGFKL